MKSWGLFKRYLSRRPRVYFFTGWHFQTDHVTMYGKTGGVMFMKILKWSLFLCVIWMSAVVPVSAKAPGKADIWQTGAKDRTVSISWREQEDAAVYKIYYKYASQGLYHYVKDVYPSGSGLRTSVKLPKAGRIYHVRVAAYDLSGGRIGTAYQAECRTLPGEVTLRSQKSYATSGSMKFFWNTVQSAAGYELRATDLSGGSMGSQRVSGRASTVFYGLPAGTFYRLRIRGYIRINGKNIYGPASYTYVGQQPRVRFKWASSSVVRVSWPEVEGAADYSVYVTDDPSRGFRRVTKVTEKQTVIPGINRNWKYYVYVVAHMRKGKNVYATPKTNYYTFRVTIQ